MLGGAALVVAALVLVITVVSFPLLLDRNIGVLPAIVTGLIVDHLGGYTYACGSADALSALGALLWWKFVPAMAWRCYRP